MQLKPLEPDHYPFFDYRSYTFSLGIEAPEGIWLSGSTAVRHDPASKTMVVEGDLLAQAAVIFDKMRAALVPVDRTPRHLTRLVRYVRADALEQLPRLDAYQREILGEAVVSTIVVERLLRANALIEMEASITASPGDEPLPSIIAPDARTAREALDRELSRRGLDESSLVRFAQFSTDGAAPVRGPAGIAVLCSRLPGGGSGVQIEATVAASSENRIVHAAVQGDPRLEGIGAQCRDALLRLDAKLADAGSGLEHVIKTTEFIAPQAVGEYRETAAVRREVFDAPYPAATGVVCAGFREPGCLIVMEAVARVGGR